MPFSASFQPNSVARVTGPSPAPQPPADTSAETRLVLTFLESVGKRQDAELYVKLFREVPKPSFALVAIDSEILNDAMGLLVDGLQFLSRLTCSRCSCGGSTKVHQ